MKVPFFDATRQYHEIEQEINSAVLKVLASGKFVLGEEGINIEKNLAEFIGVKHGVAVNSGTDALKIALKALGVEAGDEVITVSNTAVPTVSAMREIGAIPVFVDINEYFLIDINKIEEKITSKTKAIVAVHLYGQPTDIKKIIEIAQKHKIKVVEDCAQAIGAEIDGRRVGSFGDVSCFSFYPTKNLGAYGDGGLILTNDENLEHQARMLRFYGMEKTYYANFEGFNSRMDEVQATILSIKLNYLEKWNTRRREIADFYLKNIKNEKIVLPALAPNTKHVFHLFVVKTKDRDALKQHCEKNEVGVAIHYPFPIHLQRAYEFLNYKTGDLPNSESASSEILSLPMFPELSDEELKHVVETINAF